MLTFKLEHYAPIVLGLAVYFGWVGVNGHFLWMNGGGRRYILGGWGCVDIFYGRGEVGSGVEVYFVLVRVCGQFSWVGGGG